MSDNKKEDYNKTLEVMSGNSSKYRFYHSPTGRKFLNYLEGKEKNLMNKIEGSVPYNNALSFLNKARAPTSMGMTLELLNGIINSPSSRQMRERINYYNGTPMEI